MAFVELRPTRPCILKNRDVMNTLFWLRIRMYEYQNLSFGYEIIFDYLLISVDKFYNSNEKLKVHV